MRQAFLQALNPTPRPGRVDSWLRVAARLSRIAIVVICMVVVWIWPHIILVLLIGVYLVRKAIQ